MKIPDKKTANMQTPILVNFTVGNPLTFCMKFLILNRHTISMNQYDAWIQDIVVLKKGIDRYSK